MFTVILCQAVMLKSKDKSNYEEDLYWEHCSGCYKWLNICGIILIKAFAMPVPSAYNLLRRPY